jgi:hypothetical protein
MQHFIVQHNYYDVVNRDLSVLVPEHIRRLPDSWTNPTEPLPQYYAYLDFCKKFEIQLDAVNKRAVKAALDNDLVPNDPGCLHYPPWARPDALLKHMYNIQVFWHGPLDDAEIEQRLPRIVQKSPGDVKRRIAAILSRNERIFEKTITKLIKPITM